VHARRGVPCRGLSIGELEGRAALAPAGIRTLLVSRFHTGEVEATRRGPEVVSVPIEASPDLARRLAPRGKGPALVVETDATEARDLVRDAGRLGLPFPVEPHVVSDVEDEVEELSRGERPLLLSPRVYGWIGPELRRRENVHQLAFRIAESAWPSIADALGLPLGTAGGRAD